MGQFSVKIYTSPGSLLSANQQPTLSLFAYGAVAFASHVPWGTALYDMPVPRFVFDAPHALALVAILGTTINPYLFFWQSSQEVERSEERRVGKEC